MLSRSGHGDVEQTLLFFGVSQPGFSAMYSPARSEIAPMRRPVSPVDQSNSASAAALCLPSMPVWQPARITMGNSKPFRFVNAHDAHGIEVFFGEHAFAFIFDVEHALFQLADRFLERGQSFAAKQLGLLRQLLQICHRLFAVKIAGRQQFHRQRREYMGYRGANRQSAGLIMQARQRVIELVRASVENLSSEFRGSAVVEQVLPVQLINLLVGEPAQRARVDTPTQRQADRRDFPPARSRLTASMISFAA